MTRTITLEKVEALRQLRPRRCRILDHQIVRKKADDSYVVSTKFSSLDRLFELETGIFTNSGPYGPYVFLTRQEEVERALQWQEARRRYVFIRDTLDCSIALDFNLAEAGKYTELGWAEHCAKAERHAGAIDFLAENCAETISKLGFYNSCPVICAIPPSPEKQWDLPTELANRIAKKLQRNDFSSEVRFSQLKQSVKNLPLRERWTALEAARLDVSGALNGQSVILIDDKYQSGTTMQFVASKLLEAGASEVYGIACVKTWRDTDNT